VNTNPLAAVIATALEASRIVDEERVRQIVREELANMQTSPVQHGWVSPPRAAKLEGITTKRVYALIDQGLVSRRAKNPGSPHPKWEISLDSLRAALGHGVNPRAPVVSAAGWAAQRAARKAVAP
jgi:hypothetical protein